MPEYARDRSRESLGKLRKLPADQPKRIRIRAYSEAWKAQRRQSEQDKKKMCPSCSARFMHFRSKVCRWCANREIQIGRVKQRAERDTQTIYGGGRNKIFEARVAQLLYLRAQTPL